VTLAEGSSCKETFVVARGDVKLTPFGSERVALSRGRDRESVVEQTATTETLREWIGRSHGQSRRDSRPPPTSKS